MTLDEQQAICDAATPGPWVGDRYDGTVKYSLYGTRSSENEDPPIVLRLNHDYDYGFIGDRGDQDEVFIIAARTHWPECIARLRQADAEIEELRFAKAHLLELSSVYRETEERMKAEIFDLREKLSDIERLAKQIHRSRPPGPPDPHPSELLVDRIVAMSEYEGADTTEMVDGVAGLATHYVAAADSQISVLKAEIERLREAGEVLARQCLDDGDLDWACHEFLPRPKTPHGRI